MYLSYLGTNLVENDGMEIALISKSTNCYTASEEQCWNEHSSIYGTKRMNACLEEKCSEMFNIL